jgi:hypothetical protein
MKTHNFSTVLIFAAFFIISSGCNFLGTYERGNGNVITVTRNLSSLNKISIGGNFEVLLRKSDTNSVTIISDENLEKLIKTEVENGELKISSPKKLISVKKTKLEINYVHLNQIRVSGATLLNSSDLLESEKLELSLEGAGMIDLQIKVVDLEAQLSGAGIVKFNGYATNASISLSGAGGLEAYGLETLNCKIDVSGLGGAKINVKNDLTATIEGVGGIQYIGHPEKVNKNVSGVGTIKEENQPDDDSSN